MGVDKFDGYIDTLTTLQCPAIENFETLHLDIFFAISWHSDKIQEYYNTEVYILCGVFIRIYYNLWLTHSRATIIWSSLNQIENTMPTLSCDPAYSQLLDTNQELRSELQDEISINKSNEKKFDPL